MTVQTLEIGQKVEYKTFKGIEREEVYKEAEVTQILEGAGIYVMVMDGKSWMNGKEFLVLSSELTELIRF